MSTRIPYEKLKATLTLCAAYDDAASLHRDAWEFAVALSELLASGTSAADLRWLVAAGYAEHAFEVRAPGLGTRQFEPEPKLAFSHHTCFIATKAGRRLMHDTAALLLRRSSTSANGSNSHGTGLVCWNTDSRELRINDCLVKRLRRRATSQEAVLLAFEKAGWCSPLPNPLNCPECGDAKRRLREVVADLNKHHLTEIIRFHCKDGGSAVSFEIH